MNTINKVILLGRLVREPELRYTQNGIAVCNFTLAVDRAYSNGSEKEADFIDIVVWNKPAENTAKYMAKGKQCAVEGRLQIRSYEGNDGQKRWRTEVVANQVEFLGGGSKKQESQGGFETHGQQVDAPAGGDPFGHEVTFEHEEMPF